MCDGTDILIPGIMEHIERTGVHSGDSISVYPAPTISDTVKETIAEYSRRLAKALHVIGLINIQFIAMGEEVYVIEVNPRSSRTVPYISKVTGIPIVDLGDQKSSSERRSVTLVMNRDFSRRQIILRSRCRYSPSRRSVVLRSVLDRK